MMEEMDTDRDGVISEDEFVMAFLRNEMLSTNMINKIMTRFTSAQTCILEMWFYLNKFLYTLTDTTMCQ